MVDKKEPKMKLRMTYPKGFRIKGQGVACVSIEMSNGDRMEHFERIDHLQAEFLKWASAMAFCDEVRELPDLEKIVRELIGSKGFPTRPPNEPLLVP